MWHWWPHELTPRVVKSPLTLSWPDSGLRTPSVAAWTGQQGIEDFNRLKNRLVAIVEWLLCMKDSLYHPKGQTLFFNCFRLKCFIGS